MKGGRSKKEHYEMHPEARKKYERRDERDYPDPRMRPSKAMLNKMDNPIEMEYYDYYDQEGYMSMKSLKKKPTRMEDLIPFFEIDYSLPKQIFTAKEPEEASLAADGQQKPKAKQAK
ncbi:hypothetical protein GPJ56_001195 [Histomonas meleagridis]|uniref:uncharacterized protein n=1 Tax=Histomonas meleagridis TaxID=135588 RepID=UPI003559B2DD|nr:hypothetical protein GPJ56_001195 [Histomonas meleagridis]KAH0799842.1 hypothetical protein GO595_006954 [Histomonas meleagridis]